jgi:LacI family transcriptional regulator
MTQPAFEIGKAAASLLLKYLDKPNGSLVKEKIVIPSSLIARDSTKN